MDKLTEINVYTDGGSRGNPGPAALGVHIESSAGSTIGEVSKYLGINTNNFAEYSAIISALSWILENKEILITLKKINFFMDSLLAVSQINGIYKIKSPSIRELFIQVKTLESEIKVPITYTHVLREKNKKADALVNLALDNQH